MDMSQGNAGTAAEILNGSDILVRCLQAENVKFMWGYPGGAVLYIYDALYKQDTIEHVLVRTSRPPFTLLTAMPAPPAMSVSPL
jgi:acetolactate synthase I/II/III large subunit